MTRPRRRTNLGSRIRRTDGFSLMEILIGVSILGIVYAILFSLMTTSLRNVNRIESREKIVLYGQMKLNELVLNAGQGKFDQPLNGRFDEKYHWQAQIWAYDAGQRAATAPPYQVAYIRLSVMWPGSEQQNQYTLETMTWVPLQTGAER